MRRLFFALLLFLGLVSALPAHWMLPAPATPTQPAPAGQPGAGESAPAEDDPTTPGPTGEGTPPANNTPSRVVRGGGHEEPSKDGEEAGEKKAEANDAKDAAQMKKLSPGEIKKLQDAGEDIHALKGSKNASKLDLFKDSDGNIYVKPKDGSGPGDPTGLNINDH